jgi:hypothetical protein
MSSRRNGFIIQFSVFSFQFSAFNLDIAQIEN